MFSNSLENSGGSQSQKFPKHVPVEYSEPKSAFWGKFLTLRTSRKFSRQFENMFWVRKTFCHIRGIQRILNQTRTRSKTFFIDGNLKFLIFSRKSSPKKLYLSQNILPDVALRVSRKFSTQFVGVFWQ